MGENTNIEWARHTFNAWIGCQEVSPACDHCYARVQNAHWKWVDGWGQHGERKRTSPANWRKPLAWDRAAAAAGERPGVFCNSLADVFDNKVPPGWRADLFDLIRQTPNLMWLLLTKRPQNIIKMLAPLGGLPPNFALGTTVEDQKRANQRLPYLIHAKHNLRPAFAFVSGEPLLGPVDLRSWIGFLDWVIVGGESGPGSRPMHPDWVRGLLDQCAAADVPFLFKQRGDYTWEMPGYSTREPDTWVNVANGRMADEARALKRGRWAGVFRVGKHAAGRLLDGRVYHQMPAGLVS